MVFKELIFNTFYFGQSVVVIQRTQFFNSFYFGRGVVVLKELSFNSFYFGRVCWSSKNRFLTLSILGRWGSIERTVF